MASAKPIQNTVDVDDPTSGVLHAPTKRLLNTSEAGMYLGIAAGTLHVWRSTKKHSLPYVKIGSRVLYRVEDLDAFIANHRVGALAS